MASFFHAHLSPMISVIATLETEDTLSINNLTLVDLFRPFTAIKGKIPTKDKTNITNYNVRFAEHEDISNGIPKDHKIAEEILRKMCKEASRDTWSTDRNAKRGASTDGDNESDHKKPRYENIPIFTTKAEAFNHTMKTIEDMTPWYSSYRDLFFRLCLPQPHSTISHPVAVLIAVCASASDPVSEAIELITKHKAPPAFEKYYIDPNILRIYVLIQNMQMTDNSVADANFAKMKAHFGLQCHHLRLNSVPLQVEVGTVQTASLETSQLFASHLAPTFVNTEHTLSHHSSSVFNLEILAAQSQNVAVPQDESRVSSNQSLPEIPQLEYGKYLSDLDLDGVRGFIHAVIVQDLIPYMEKCVYTWNEQMIASRKGLTGRLFSVGKKYFSTSAKPEKPVNHTGLATDQDGNPYYPYDCMEMQLLRLADFAFLLRDYKFASSTYDLVRKDFGTEKAANYHAACLEMGALSTLLQASMTPSESLGTLSGPSLVSIDYERVTDPMFQEAAMLYSKKCNAPQLAARCVMLQYEAMKLLATGTDGLRDAANGIFRSAFELDNDLRGALFLEQAAFCNLKSGNPLIRKYNFYLVLAGHRFVKAGQRYHAIRSYANGLALYDGIDWGLMEDHINFMLGRQIFHTGNVRKAFSYFVKLLARHRQPQQQQITYLREFLYLYKNLPPQADDDLNLNLCVPEFDDRTTHFIARNAVQSQATSIGLDETKWAEMEVQVRNELLRDLKDAKLGDMDTARTSCSVSEPVYLKINVRNPLDIPLELGNLSLNCKYYPGEKVTPTSEAQACAFISQTSDTLRYEHFEMQSMPDLIIEGQQSKMIVLLVTPTSTGSLQVISFDYTLSKMVQCQHIIAKKGRRLTATAAERVQKLYAADQSLTLLVTAQMPLLNVEFERFPESVIEGEIVEMKLLLRNTGIVPLRNLIVKMSNPNCFEIGETRSRDATGWHCANMIETTTSFSIMLPENVLAPNSSTTVPVTFRSQGTGKASFNFVFGYQSARRADVLNYRLLRWSLSTNISPAIFTTPSVKADHDELHEYSIRLKTEVQVDDLPIQIIAITCLSASWQMSRQQSEHRQSQFQCKLKRTRETQEALLKQLSESQLTPERYTVEAINNFLESIPLKIHIPAIDLGLSTVTAFEDQHKPMLPSPKFFFRHRNRYRVQALAAMYPGVPAATIPNIFTLYTLDDLDFIIHWMIPGTSRTGQFYVFGHFLGIIQSPISVQLASAAVALISAPKQTRSMYGQTDKDRELLRNSLLRSKTHMRISGDDNPIKWAIKAPTLVVHNFATGGLEIPIELHLLNASWCQQLSFTFDVTPLDESGDTTAISWTNRTTLKSILDPERTKVIHLVASIREEGYYDINKWRISVFVDKVDFKTSIRSSTTNTRSRGSSKAGMIQNAGIDTTATSFLQMPDVPHYISVQEP